MAFLGNCATDGFDPIGLSDLECGCHESQDGGHANNDAGESETLTLRSTRQSGAVVPTDLSTDDSTTRGAVPASSDAAGTFKLSWVNVLSIHGIADWDEDRKKCCCKRQRRWTSELTRKTEITLDITVFVIWFMGTDEMTVGEPKVSTKDECTTTCRQQYVTDHPETWPPPNPPAGSEPSLDYNFWTPHPAPRPGQWPPNTIDYPWRNDPK